MTAVGVAAFVLTTSLAGCSESATVPSTSALVGTWRSHDGAELVIDADGAAAFHHFPLEAVRLHDDGFLDGTASWTRSSVNSGQIDFVGVDTLPHRFERYGWPGVYVVDAAPEIIFWIGDPDNGERVELHRATLIVRPVNR